MFVLSLGIDCEPFRLSERGSELRRACGRDWSFLFWRSPCQRHGFRLLLGRTLCSFPKGRGWSGRSFEHAILFGQLHHSLLQKTVLFLKLKRLESFGSVRDIANFDRVEHSVLVCFVASVFDRFENLLGLRTPRIEAEFFGEVLGIDGRSSEHSVALSAYDSFARSAERAHGTRSVMSREKFVLKARFSTLAGKNASFVPKDGSFRSFDDLEGYFFRRHSPDATRVPRMRQKFVLKARFSTLAGKDIVRSQVILGPEKST
jgi:hypothetical protein